MAVFKLGSPGSIQIAADIVSSRVIDRYLSDSTRQRQHQVDAKRARERSANVTPRSSTSSSRHAAAAAAAA